MSLPISLSSDEDVEICVLRESGMGCGLSSNGDPTANRVHAGAAVRREWAKMLL